MMHTGLLCREVVAGRAPVSPLLWLCPYHNGWECVVSRRRCVWDRAQGQHHFAHCVYLDPWHISAQGINKTRLHVAHGH
jgi:hypothetical protein